MVKDPYIQENGTLRNKLNITDYDGLNLAEKDITFSKFLNVGKTFRTKFDISYIKSIHKYIFEDIFDWAGEFRKVPIYKQELVIPGISLDYTNPNEIEPALTICLEKFNNTNWDELSLEEKTSIFTKYLTEFWKIHPFRDGNTRTTLTFAYQFSKEYGFPIDLGCLLDNLTRKYDTNGNITQFSIRDKFVLSAIPDEHCPEPEHLTSLIHKSIVSGISKNIESLKKSVSNNDVEREI